MDKRRGSPLFLILMFLLVAIGLALFAYGATTYKKPNTLFDGPPAYLRNTLPGEHIL